MNFNCFINENIDRPLAGLSLMLFFFQLNFSTVDKLVINGHERTTTIGLNLDKTTYCVVACVVPSGTILDLLKISSIVASVTGRNGKSSSAGILDLPTT